MNWFLRLFPQYRALETAARQAAELATRLQDMNFNLSEQNIKLGAEAQESRAAHVRALQSIVNIRMQVEYGGMPMFPEAYALPKQEETDLGPVATDRIQGRDLVNAGMQEFHEQIAQIRNRPPRG
jgi:hypothetical protein